jgi:tRNA threonylcarbamoyl adenosine modification protein YeaZ/ribosomal-protein-alanine acetyltransferase
VSAVLLLAIDTSTTAITVALHDGSSVVAEFTTLDARGHAEHLSPGIVRVLEQAGAGPQAVSDIVVGLGPGPFTGLRVGIVTARTLAVATGATLHGMCSLDALAHEAWRTGTVADGQLVVATDARRKEVYWARYAVTAGSVERVTEPQVGRPADLPAEVRNLPVVGRGPLLYPAEFRRHGIPRDVSAGWLADLAVARLGRGEAVDEREPYYLRRPDAVPSVSAASAPPGGVGGRMRLREMVWQDIPVLAGLDAQLFVGDAWDEPTWWAELAARPRRDYVVAVEGGQVVGYAGLDHGPDVADVMAVAVAPGHQGRGLGDELMRELGRRAAAAGAGALVLEVRADNAPALRLYQRHGFEQVRVRHRYYQPDDVDALVMRRRIGPGG